MQNDDNVSPQPQYESLPVQQPPMPSITPTPATSAPTSSPIPHKTPLSQNILEYTMFAFAVVTIISFLFNNGVLLKVGLIAAMLTAVISISMSLSRSSFKTAPTIIVENPEPNIQPIQPAEQKENATAVKRIFKILGITLVVIAILPVIGYGLMIAFLIFLLIFGGGQMGT